MNILKFKGEVRKSYFCEWYLRRKGKFERKNKVQWIIEKEFEPQMPT